MTDSPSVSFHLLSLLRLSSGHVLASPSPLSLVDPAALLFPLIRLNFLFLSGLIFISISPSCVLSSDPCLSVNEGGVDAETQENICVSRIVLGEMGRTCEGIVPALVCSEPH